MFPYWVLSNLPKYVKKCQNRSHEVHLSRKKKSSLEEENENFKTTRKLVPGSMVPYDKDYLRIKHQCRLK